MGNLPVPVPRAAVIAGSLFVEDVRELKLRDHRRRADALPKDSLPSAGVEHGEELLSRLRSRKAGERVRVL